MIGFVNRQVFLAGRSCCAGRSWVSLDRTLTRWQDDPRASSCPNPGFPDPDVRTEPVARAARPDREPDEAAPASARR
jgi:hypothetical protein